QGTANSPRCQCTCRCRREALANFRWCLARAMPDSARPLQSSRIFRRIGRFRQSFVAEQLQREKCSGLLRGLFAAALSFRENAAIEAHSDAKCLGVLGARFGDDAVFGWAAAAALQPLLKRGLVIGFSEKFGERGRIVQERAVDKGGSCFVARIAKNCTDDGLVRISEEILLEAAAGFFFSRAEAQIT